MQEEIVIGTAGTITSAVGTAIQTSEILRIISLVITIIGALVTYIGIPLYNWYKKSKADGKVDKDELKEGIKIVVDGGKEVKEKIEDIKDKE